MKASEMDQIRQSAGKIRTLLERVGLPCLELTSDTTRNSFTNKQNQYRLKQDYRKKVLAILGDDWASVVRILEDVKPQNWLSRIEIERKSVLDHTQPDDESQNRLEASKDGFGPNEFLTRTIEQLAKELSDVADIENKKRMKAIIKGLAVIFCKVVVTISGTIILLAAILQISSFFGWLESIKACIGRIVTGN